MSDRERLEELAALVAAGAATADEERELARVRAADAEADELAAEFEQAAALLAEGLPRAEAPGRVLDGVRQRIAEDRGKGQVVSLAQRRGGPARIVAAIAVAAAAALALLWWRERGEAERLTERLAEIDRLRTAAEARADRAAAQLAEVENEQLRMSGMVEMVSAPSSKLATVAKDKATMKVLVDPDRRRWLVLAFELPPLPPDKDYQLWFMPDEGNPLPAGLLEPGPGAAQLTRTDLPEGVNVTGAAISIEPAGGSKTPTMDQIILAGPVI